MTRPIISKAVPQLKTVPLCEHGVRLPCQPTREGHGEPHIDEMHGKLPICVRCGLVKPYAGWAGKCRGQTKMREFERIVSTLGGET